MVDAPLSLITRTDLVMCFISFSAPPSLSPSLPPPNTSSLRDPFNSLASLPPSQARAAPRRSPSV